MVASLPPTRQATQRQGRPHSWPAKVQRREHQRRDNRTLSLIEGSLSSHKIARRSPWLASLHRFSDGTLVGLGLCMLTLSALNLHWQTRWGQSYEQLETSQVLEHRLQEASAVLEQHHLGAVRKPGWLQATRTEKLVYLPAPAEASAHPGSDLLGRVQTRMQSRQIPAGY